MELHTLPNKVYVHAYEQFQVRTSMSTDVDDEETSIRDDDTTKSPSSVIGGTCALCVPYVL